MARILIVDDEPVNRLLVKTILEHAGHQVAEAADAAQALRETGENPPDLAIVDLHLPGTSGVELVQAIRRNPQTSAMRIALYTGSTVDAAMRDFMTAHQIEHVIPKPCEPQELIDLVNVMSESSRGPA
jgi:CheY-like chemotaxis protein